MRALSIASTGMQAQQTNVETIANNLANMNTTGFKLQRAEFQDLLYQNVQTPGAQTSDAGTYAPNGIQIGVGVKTAAIYRITTQGDLSSTSNPYDMAIQGPGFFRIQQADGTDAYTRAGNFGLSPQGQLVTQDGMVVQPGIAIPQNTLSVSVNAQGQVNATVAGNATPQTVGQLELTRFPNEAGLNALGGNLYLETPASGSPQAGVPGSAGYGTIQQGFLETSNVNAVDEITSLITAQRAYEMNSKVVSAADQMLQDTARLGGLIMKNIIAAALILFAATPALADVRIVVPTRDIARGDTLGETDLTYANIAGKALMSGVATSFDDLKGMQARRMLHAGEAVRADDVRHPIVITKGQTITMRFSAPGVELNAVGRAMAEGGVGDTITVQNPASFRMISALVTGPGTVSATGPQIITARK